VAALGPSSHADWKELARVSGAFGIHLDALQIEHAREFEGAFNAARTKRVNGLVVLPHAETNFHRTRIINFAAGNKVPAMYPLEIYAVDGGLMSYGPDLSAMRRRAAYYVDRILRGTKPSDLPIEQPNRSEFVINLKAAKQIGLTIPPGVLARADKVIK
jgi:putative ABC transport system substrate-binding protein